MAIFTLNNGVTIPALGFGVFAIEDQSECAKAVTLAVEAGYRLIDTAAFYENEVGVGMGVKDCGIPRSELFITSKVWGSDAGYDKTLQSFQETLKKLQLDYLDLYLIHQPVGDYYGSWRAMEKLYKEGYIKAIGVSNFYEDRLCDLILHNEIVPAVNQLETHPFKQREEMSDIMQEYNILHEAWAPFDRNRCNIFTSPLLVSLAEKHNRSTAQIILRWLFQRNIVSLPKSATPSRIASNYQIWDFQLSPADMEAIRHIGIYDSMDDHHSASTIKRISTLVPGEKD